MTKPLTAAIFSTAALFCGLQVAHSAESLNKIVNPSLLGTTVKYAEFLIGAPAMLERMDDVGIQRNSYERKGCYISLGVDNGKVISVGMFFDTAKGCDLDVSETVNRRGAKGSKTTFKDYAWRGPLHFTDPQLPSCNACGEGSFNALIDGVGVMSNLSIQLSADTYGPGNNHDAWRSLLRKNGIDGSPSKALPLTAENCPLRKFDAQAYEILKNTPVTGIAYSRTPEALQPTCSGETVWSLIRRGSN